MVMLLLLSPENVSAQESLVMFIENFCHRCSNPLFKRFRSVYVHSPCLYGVNIFIRRCDITSLHLRPNDVCWSDYRSPDDFQQRANQTA